MRGIRVACFSTLVAISALAADCQTGTGLYALGSFDAHGFDTVNNGNLNVHFSIPIFSKAGRGGQNFYYSLVYDSMFWQPTTAAGNTAWTPASFGWAASQPDEGIVGQLTYGVEGIICQATGQIGYIASNVIYNRSDGTAATFSGQFNSCSPAPLGPASDGSTLLNLGTVELANGSIVNPPNPLSPFYTNPPEGVTDGNGNIISWAPGAFTDTTGTTVLSIANGVYTFPTLNGTSSVRENLQQYTVQTAFHCPEVSEYGPLSNQLVSSIQLPDGSTYQFTYEPTPGVPGATTGRLASITLPTGGTISYQYSGTSGGCSPGVNPSGGSPILTRTAEGGTTTYDTTQTGYSTKVTRPSNDFVNYQFISLSGVPYETHRQVYSVGSSVPALDLATCYNGASPNCDGQSLTSSITSLSTYVVQNAGLMTGADTSIDSSGNVTLEASYDYGSSTARGAVIKTEVFTYNSYATEIDMSDLTLYGSVEKLTSAAVTNGAGSMVSLASYSYDDTPTTNVDSSGSNPVVQHMVLGSTKAGNLTTVTQMGLPSPDLVSTYQYYNTGTVQSSTVSASGAAWSTNYGYDPTYTFLQNATLPTPASGVPLSIGASVDLTSGLATSSAGVNTATTAIRSYDAMLRPTEIDYADGGWTKYTYTPNQISVTGNVDGTRASDTEVKLDGFGRTIRTATLSSTSGQVWFQNDTCYDSSGRVSYQSPTYQGGGIGDNNYSCSGAGNAYSYDGLNRATRISNADGAVTITYNSRAKKVTDVNGVQKVTQTDALGRISSVCEVSSSTAALPGGDVPTACNQDIAANGFLTSYTYDLGNHKTTITQGVQQRIFQTDFLGRTIYTKEPERGETTYQYAYNATGMVVTRTRGAENQTNAANKTITTTQYDSLGRPISIGYSNGQPTKSYTYDVAPASFAGGAPYNAGNLASVSATGVASSDYAYDSMGRVVKMDQCFPGLCQDATKTVFTSYQYDQAGDLLQENYPLAGNFGPSATTGSNSWTYDQAGNVAGIGNSQAGPIVSNVTQGPNGPSVYGFPNNMTVASRFDTMGRRWQSWVCEGSNQPGCTNGVTDYGWVAQPSGNRLTQVFDTSTGLRSNPTYDAMNRLQSIMYQNLDCSYNSTMSWTYDRYGNRWSQSVSGGNSSAAQPTFSFDVTTNHVSGGTYDAAGNLIQDTQGNTYTYDADGNLLTSTGGWGTTQSTYDALNRRVAYQSGAATTLFAFNPGGQRSAIYDGSENLLQNQVYWGSTALAFIKAGTLSYQFQNWVGTEVFNVAPSSSQTQYASNPFGDGFTTTSGSDSDPLHYAGLDGDSDGTMHASYRNYNPTQAQWLSPDPSYGSYRLQNPQSFNRYAYAKNNPLSRNDPSGMDDGDWGDNGNPCDNTECELDEDDSGTQGGGSGGSGTPCYDYDQNGNVYIVPCGNGTGSIQGGNGGTVSVNLNGGTNYDPGIYVVYFGAAAGPNSDGSGGGGGADNGRHYTQVDVCGASAVVNKGLPILLDALGIIPGEGNILAAVQVGAGLASAATESNATDAAIAGSGLGLSGVYLSGAADITKKVFDKSLHLIPIAGNILSAAATLRDAYGEDGIEAYYNSCLAGKN